MKNNILLIIFIALGLNAFGQQEVQFTHYAYHKLAYNPAVAGSLGNGVLGAIYRNQWSGIPGAPRTGSIYGHMPIMNDKAGVGLYLTNDRLGFTSSNFAAISYAYRMKIGYGMTLSLGLQGEIEHTSLDWSKADPNSVNDQIIGSGASNKVGGNAGAGLYLQHRKFFFGFSVPRLFKNTLYRNVGNTLSNRDFRSYFISGGANVPLTNNVTLVPMALISFGPSIPASVDLGANFLFFQKSVWEQTGEHWTVSTDW
ncbi:MAG: PorP/SprF family type IX secretion system membrane protein [Saprospiraceae bacterium]|nr:PorP/SprF family type IX secretion system membrane protein [Saprospiraceae bacterium]